MNTKDTLILVVELPSFSFVLCIFPISVGIFFYAWLVRFLNHDYKVQYIFHTQTYHS